MNHPEAKIQKEVISYLTLKGWYVKPTHGNAFQAGLPDLFCCHQSHGIRWIEIKVKEKYRFTEAQVTVFTQFAKRNLGVYILTGKEDYDCLFRGANWHTFLWKSRGIDPIKNTVKIIPKSGPEAIIQNAVIAKLTQQDWFCIETYGSMFQSGLPDIFAAHKEFGTKWIECKNPKAYRFTPAQIRTFPMFSAHGVGIWILTSDDINVLNHPANWHSYLKGF